MIKAQTISTGFAAIAIVATLIYVRETIKVVREKEVLATLEWHQMDLRRQLSRSEQKARKLGEQSIALRQHMALAEKDENAVTGKQASSLPGRLPLPRKAELADIEFRYSRFIRGSTLVGQKLAQFDDLVIQHRQSLRDLSTVAQEQGLSSSDPTIGDMRSEENTRYSTELQNLLGPADYGKFQQIDATLGARALTDRVTADVYYTDTPLTGSQADQLTEILLEAGGTSHSDGNYASLDWDSVMKKAQSVLTPAQLTSLQRLKDSIVTSH